MSVNVALNSQLRPRVGHDKFSKPRLLVLATALVSLCGGTIAYATPTALVAARVIDGRSSTLSRATVVVVEGKKIIAMGDRSIIPANADVIELGDATLMPGMINVHEHPLMSSSDYQNAHLATSSAYKALTALAGLQKLLLAGWTGVRVMGDADVAKTLLRAVVEQELHLERPSATA